MESLHYIEFDRFELYSGKILNLKLSYQTFGQPLGTGPVVLINHALTGNSNVYGTHGWWNAIVGEEKVIDTEIFTVLAFNIPGNGFGNTTEDFTKYYKDFSAKDIARIFIEGLRQLQITQLFAVIGGSVGGGITWEMAAMSPTLFQNIIPIATDWKATDWLIANCHIQELILENSVNPVEDARAHAMTFYRTPESFEKKFNRTKASTKAFNIESWLDYHGKKLADRFQLSAYKMMNQILKSINVADTTEAFQQIAKRITGHIHIITVDSDLFFKPEENWSTFVDLKSVKDNVSIGEIKSIHGHDAFLIEYQQLSKLLKPIFNLKTTKHDTGQPYYIRNR